MRLEIINSYCTVFVFFNHFFSKLNYFQSADFDYGLRNYEEGIIIDSELALEETDEESVSTSERLFNEDIWKKWTLKSGAVVADLLPVKKDILLGKLWFL